MIRRGNLSIFDPYRYQAIAYVIHEYIVRYLVDRGSSQIDIDQWIRSGENAELEAHANFCDYRRRCISQAWRAGWNNEHRDLISDMFWHNFNAWHREFVARIRTQLPYSRAIESIDLTRNVLLFDIGGMMYRFTVEHEHTTVGPGVSEE